MIRVILSIVAIGFICLGLWLLASGFIEPAPTSTVPAQVIAAPGQNASPIVLGTALLAGGVAFFVLILRKK